MVIKELKIFSERLEQQKQFFSEKLNLKIKGENQKSISIEIGNSTLIIEQRKNRTPYHFAITIPKDKEIEALEWLKERVEILPNGSDEIIDFSSWNAKSMYFYDNDDNIVELISRKNFNNETEDKFDQNQFLEISEIGMPVDNIKEYFEFLNKHFGVEIFDGSFDRFCAIGDERGLIICIDKNKKRWFPTNDKAFSSDFEMKLLDKGKIYKMKFEDQQIFKL